MEGNTSVVLHVLCVTTIHLARVQRLLYCYLALPVWLLGLPLAFGVDGSSSSRLGVGVDGVGAFWFLSSRGFTSSWRTAAVAREGPSFFSARRLPAALAATSLSKAAEEVIDTSERKELAEAWWSGAAVDVDEAWLLSLTFLESAARVELADCGLNGELKASKRTTSSPRPPPPRADTPDEAEVDEDDDVVEETTAILS